MPNDDIKEFILSCPRSMTYREIELAIRDKFGDDRAWSHTRIVNYWQSVKFAHKGSPSRIDRDFEVRSFVGERIHRLTLSELAEACRARFGRERAPSRSSLGRYSQYIRRR
jgi:hypothetical protein